MSESDGEHAARSVALEQAYVHEVYEQCAEKTTQSKHWPRVYQFLQELEPGALVCDIGCGNGKYLSVNHSVFKIGVDRCKRFTDIAREKENEVLICDNLALPFREESFDAVLSIAVVHHFATTERRVHALKELARVLRIGGRLVISVWAMEQKHRKFESQDVLIPWPKSHCMSTASEGTKHSGVSDSNEKRDDDAAQKNQSSSKRNSQRKCKSKSYWIDPIFSLSPSTSSLSSPNETCYSCFRRALQKLARSRRGGDGRTWFPGSWQSSTKSRRHYDPEDTTDVDELPIELRRVETTHTLTMTNKHSTDTLSIKSKSLGDILEIERLDLVRSRSSIPGFSSTSELILDERSVSSSSSGSKPRLVKQKSYVEEIGLENPEDTAIENLIKDLPDFSCQSLRKRNIPLKQSSMNEELMSAERLEEKERVRRNIMKQASLNEELICKWRTFEALKDSISPVSASRRFQLLKNGLTSKLKRSTTNIEKVSSMSIKNGFVRMLQGWKSCENESASAATAEATKLKPTDNKVQPVTIVKRSIEGVERRLSREDGSDSSKDSSLQSDTSVDSEDSFASVIYVPKQDVTAPPASSSVNEVPSAPRPAALQLSTTSAPPSPRVKQPLDGGQSSRFKMISVSPLLKQQSIITNTNANTNTNLGDAMKSSVPTVVAKETFDNTLQAPASGGLRLISEPDEESDTTSLIHAFNDVTKVVSREPVVSEDDSRKARLNQIKELLIAKPGFATRTRPSFPLVRRASTAASGRLETVTRILPRLLSLELFNPETDDLDSDSSGVSSPESVGSVISVTSDERYIARKEAEEKKNNVQTDESLSKSNGDDISKRTRETESSIRDDESLKTDTICSTSRIFLENEKSISSQSMKLLKAAANVASSLEDAVEKAIQHNAQVEQFSQVAQRRNNDSIWSQSSVRTRTYLEDYKSTSEDLGDYADESSSDLIRDISRVNHESEEKLKTEIDLVSRSNLESNSNLMSDTKKSFINAESTLNLQSGARLKSNINQERYRSANTSSLLRSNSDDTLDFVMVSKTGEEEFEEDAKAVGKWRSSHGRLSMDSSDVGDSMIENTGMSLSDGSQTASTARLFTGSTVSLVSNPNVENTRRCSVERRRLQERGHSLDEMSSETKKREGCLVTASTNTLSNASSQESLPSDRGGGSITYHQYYHVFREGELDQLINKYVENLHIISSYYDHASWCVVAEKVQVWTI
ncbi:Putative methyltransferase KIAA1456 [Trachymyrmex cornetzi]|uniref:Putative methyltransferase KIAA1456 n=1 Tax=Trachymyrmex cornetzi TaxID=471704 RepID=A0A151J0C3_9HYME|nr:Putative methyltransferase KIAA1456 [Trachymyrmex cornetzi]